MQRPQQIGLAAALVIAAAVIITLLMGGDSNPSMAPLPGPSEAREAASVAVPGKTSEVVGPDVERELVATSSAGGSFESDPEIRAGLTGFRGRVVDHNKVPVADCGVELFRFALDSVLPEGVDLFAMEPSLVPELEAGEAITGEDGTFLIGGVWPKAIFLLHAGIGTDAPTHRVVSQSPAPGEILDLGDIVLNQAAVLSGRVVDDDGAPVAGALVRAVDLPGQLLGFVPVERFDPAGGVLIRESDSPIQVVEMPPWLPDLVDQLPIPKTQTDEEGYFRLIGLSAGNNAVAVTKKDFLAHVMPMVRLVAGEEKTLGDVRLDRGEELYGQVVDSAGEPVAGAQVVAGSTLPLVPVDFVSHVGPSDEEGRFVAEGFGPGNVTIAARRSDKDPWVVAEPQPVLRDVVVTLPAVASLTLRIEGAEGMEIKEPKLRLLSGVDKKAAVVLSAFGVMRPIALDNRTTTLEDGSLRIDDLQFGPYVVMASAKGARLTTAEVEVKEGQNLVLLELGPSITHRVRVLGPEDKPVRNARVYVAERGNEVRDMPWCAGRTDDEGRLEIDEAGTERIRVTASHPRWGSVHGQVRLGDGELVLRLQEPGWIEGILTDAGRAPELAKYSISAEWRPEERGVGEDMPELATPGLDGSFRMSALQPGRYRVEVMPGFQSLASPGGVLALIQEAEMGSRLPRETVQVVSGQGVDVQLNIGGQEDLGPTGTLFGSVLVNGQLGQGYTVMARAGGHRVTKEVDASGQFHLGPLPAGTVRIALRAKDRSLIYDRTPLWEERLELAVAEQKALAIDIRTTSLSGVVVRPDGGPAVGMFVRLEGRPLEEKKGSSLSSWTTTDGSGAFSFDQVVEGVFHLEVEGDDEDPVRAALVDVQATNVAPASGLRMQLQQALVVSGRIDSRTFTQPPSWGYIRFRRENPQYPGDSSKAEDVAGEAFGDELEFETRDLTPGTYLVSVQAFVRNGAPDGSRAWQHFDVVEPLIVPPQGLSEVVLLPVPREKGK
ncbi:MAG: carboxypeptidase-like regulatory domain-containing protein [Planctomycetota bacterium]|nr:carboxypeptidase-like regulatory domain-containing protein [Planctomycetota bacterium]